MIYHVRGLGHFDFTEEQAASYEAYHANREATEAFRRHLQNLPLRSPGNPNRELDEKWEAYYACLDHGRSLYAQMGWFDNRKTLPY